MSIELHIHSILTEYTDNREVIETAGKNVGECLKTLIEQYPRIEQFLFEKNGNLLRSTEILVNGEEAYPDELTMPVQDGDRVYVIMRMGCV